MIIESKSKIGVDTSVNLHKIDKPNLPKDARKKTELYVLTLKPSSPYDYLTIAGVIFSKFSLPTAAAELENQNKRFNTNIPAAQMTDDQAKYIKSRSKKIKRTIKQENVVKEVVFSDLIILEKASDFMKDDIQTKIENKLAKYDSN